MADVEFRTSGSSGEAKAIVRSGESLDADAHAIVAAFPEVWNSCRRVVATIPRDHMFGALWRVRAPAIAGCGSPEDTVVSVEGLAAACAEGNVLLATTPSFLEKALEHPGFAALKGKISTVVVSGSPLREETAWAVKAALGACPLEIFGSTEAGTVAWRRREGGGEWTLVPGVSATADPEGRLVVDSPHAMARPLAMEDAVRFTSPCRFEWLGRTDRRVKVLEQYVSLDAVEQAFAAHPFVAAARAAAWGEMVRRIGILVVPSPEGRAALAAGTYAAAHRRLRRDLSATLGALAFPRRIRFVRVLPADARGKATAAAVADALAAWCQEPVVLDWTATDTALRTCLVFPPDTECFAGHFPGHPILPGVAQLYFVRHFAHQAFGSFPDAGAWRQIKFRRLVPPGTELRLEVERRALATFAFTYSGSDGLCSSGYVEGAE